MTLAEIYLEAINMARGCHRAYRITLSRDLLGAYMVETRYGRIGCYGHTLAQAFDDEGAARRFMEGCLKRRQSSPRRIGTPYIMRHAWGL